MWPANFQLKKKTLKGERFSNGHTDNVKDINFPLLQSPRMDLQAHLSRQDFEERQADDNYSTQKCRSCGVSWSVEEGKRTIIEPFRHIQPSDAKVGIVRTITICHEILFFKKKRWKSCKSRKNKKCYFDWHKQKNILVLSALISLKRN